jgi:ubiquinone/menaquinone biosynthesis C-methylase UbiE
MSYLNHVLNYFDLAKNYRNYQLKLIKKHISGKILEVGPGRGEIIENFLDDDNKVTLVDTDEEICKILKKRFVGKNADILNCDIESLDQKFNTILYMDVIEHIKEDEKELDKAIKKLEAGGKLIIIVPAFNFLFSEFDLNVGHFKRYYKRDFQEYKNENIKIVDIKYFDSIGFFILCISKFLKIKDNDKTALGIKFWNFLIPISKLIDKIIFYSLGKSLICVYQKK